MRMAVDPRWLSMCSPSGVGNAGVRDERSIEIGLGLLDQLLQLGNLAHFLESKNIPFLITVHSDTCRIVTAVFETVETWRKKMEKRNSQISH